MLPRAAGWKNTSDHVWSYCCSIPLLNQQSCILTSATIFKENMYVSEGILGNKPPIAQELVSNRIKMYKMQNSPPSKEKTHRNI